MRFALLAASVAVGSVAIVAPVDAAFIGFDLRDSKFQVDWLYGSGGDVRAGGANDTVTRAPLFDGAGVVGGGRDEGINPTLGNWDASASWRLSHGYAISGTRADVTGIASSGYSRVDNTANGPAITEITGRTNLLTLEFTVGGDPGTFIPMLLRSNLNASGVLSSSVVRVDFLGPFGWTNVVVRDHTAGLLDQPFNAGPGYYRIEASAFVRKVTDPLPPDASWQYALGRASDPLPDFLPVPIPEPTTLAAVPVAGMLLARRRGMRRA